MAAIGLKELLNKPRHGWIFGFSTWILEKSEALSILMFIAPIITSFIFTVITSLMWYYQIIGIVKLIFSVFTIVSYIKMIQTFIVLKKVGSITNMIDSSVNDIFYRGKDGNRKNYVEENEQDEYGKVSSDNESIGEQTKRTNSTIKRTGESFGDLISKSKEDS